MQDQEINNLLIKYRTNTCTESELILLENWYLQKACESQLNITQTDAAEAEMQIWQHINPAGKRVRKIRLWQKIAAAAVVICTVSAAAYFLNSRNPTSISNTASTTTQHDILPASDKTILTLANGKTILLDKGKGQANPVQQPGVSITTLNNGELVYTIDTVLTTAATQQFNKVETPCGGQFQIRLPDGTKVWLNATSSIRYPLAFASDRRIIELKGEGYFEVSKDTLRPFIVKTETQNVEVLGTHFNINSYNNERTVKTTLLEGSVRVTLLNGNSTVLKPGQQSATNQSKIDVNMVDTENIIAWKNGYFNFKNEELSSIMRKVSRWYNVDIEYQNNTESIAFYGVISRSKSINSVLKVLELSGEVKFKLEGRRVLVMNK